MRRIGFLSIFTRLVFVVTAVAAPNFADAQQAAAPEIARIRALVDAYNHSGQEVFAEMAKRPGNIVASPLSIGMAMAMARSGARGETESEMAGVLKHSLSREDMEQANSDLLATLVGYRKDALDRERQNQLNQIGCCQSRTQTAECFVKAQSMKPPAQAPFVIEIANAIALGCQKNIISSNYLKLIQAAYAANTFGSAATEINAWVQDKTHNRINKILDQDSRAATSLCSSMQSTSNRAG